MHNKTEAVSFLCIILYGLEFVVDRLYIEIKFEYPVIGKTISKQDRFCHVLFLAEYNKNNL